MRKIFNILFLTLLWGCTQISTPAQIQIASLPAGCNAPGTVVSAELARLTRGYPYQCRVYLPPCYAAESDSRYPVLYLVPGRSSSPDSWMAAGLPEEMDVRPSHSLRA